MKKFTVGIFRARSDAEKAINAVHRDLSVPDDDISYIYRNTEGDVKEISAEEISSKTPGEDAKKGAAIGGGVGALAGIAAVIGAIPAVGPIFAAGPLAAALGLTGAVGTTAAGALTGAAAGGLIGALVGWGVDEPEAKAYADSVNAGNILVAVHADEEKDVATALRSYNASEVNMYTLAV